MTEWYENTEVNSDRILTRGSADNLDNADMAKYVIAQLSTITPFRLWDIQVYDNIVGDDLHQITCNDCFFYMHYNNRYDIVISSLSNDTVANLNVTQDQRIVEYSN